MLDSQHYKNIAIKFAILTALALWGPVLLNKYILKYLSFFGTLSNTIASFIVIFVLLILGNWILNKSLSVSG